ncbi:PQQ-binding-like beta-propeller repeat protein [Haladaptatus pallidirubidus]|uniref:Pyrrolo-quinoline quinone repeat domain-containing protein n=1 Tax=Haladaptatus pallidirubidus TaxID=1008152 RepID=A0AAV3UI42_9EURY|nr:PQQ-binding-like beta-propeller repeat protein [Haladaptatus pallidirubidus]
MNETNRRGFLKSAGILGATLTVGAQFTPSVKGANGIGNSWTTSRGNASRTGATTDSGPGSNVTTNWSFDMNGGMHTTEPVVENGIVYLSVATVQSPSSSNGYVAAYDVKKQTTLWKHENISRPGTPTLGNGTIYFGTYGSEDANSTGFFALDSTSGKTKWQKSSQANISDPLFTDGRLYVSTSSGISQLNPNTGDVIWSTNGINSGACYADGKLFCGEGIALNANDGSVLWDVSGDKDELQTVTNGTVYSVHKGNGGKPAIKARSVNDGSVQWSYSPNLENSWWNATLAIANGHVFFCAGNSVQALDAQSGTEAWSHEINAELTNAPSVGNNTLYVAGRTTRTRDDGDAVVVAIDTTSGKRKWKYSFGSWDFDEYGPAAKSPVIADGRVYVATYPMGSTLDWMYTEYADFHILGSGNQTTTTDGQTGETTTTTPPETTTTNNGPGKTTTSKTGQGTTTTSNSPPAQSTQTTSTTTSMSETTTTESIIGATETTTTTSDGQPGFGVLTTIGGLAGIGAYLRSQLKEE